MKFKSSHEELVQMFPDQQKEEKEFLSSSVRRRQQQGELHGLIWDLKMYHGCFRTYFKMSVGSEKSCDHICGGREIISGNFRETFD